MNAFTAFVANQASNDLMVCLSADGQTWSAAIRVKGKVETQFTKQAPSLAVFNNQLWVAFVANQASNDLVVCSWADKQPWSAAIRVQGNGERQFTKQAPSLAVFNNQLWVAFVANQASNDLVVCSSADGQTWSAAIRVQGNGERQFTKQAPSLAVFNNQLWVAFVANQASNDLVVCSSADGQTWSAAIRVQGNGETQFTKQAPSLAVFNNQLWVAFVANQASNDLVVCSSADGQTWSAHIPVQGNGETQFTKQAPSLTDFPPAIPPK